MWLTVSRELSQEYAGLRAYLFKVTGVNMTSADKISLDEAVRCVVQRVAADYSPETLKDNSLVRSYRDFFWRVGLDPTKTRPAAEALLRRILSGKAFPRINPLVDTYNLASVESGIPIAAFDLDKVREPLLMRRARRGETFLGIGMREPQLLEGKEVVVSDAEKLIAIYPYRDAAATMVTEKSTNILFMVCGAPSVGENQLEKTTNLTSNYVTRICGGTVIHEW